MNQRGLDGEPMSDILRDLVEVLKVIAKDLEVIERKIKGHYLAAQNLPASCPECASILEPVDFGVDPDTNERLWVTHCCGKWDKYLEVLGPRDLI
jgi:hypothetical protein